MPGVADAANLRTAHDTQKIEIIERSGGFGQVQEGAAKLSEAAILQRTKRGMSNLCLFRKRGLAKTKRLAFDGDLLAYGEQCQHGA
jgi:hypothetical protein